MYRSTSKWVWFLSERRGTWWLAWPQPGRAVDEQGWGFSLGSPDVSYELCWAAGCCLQTSLSAAPPLWAVRKLVGESFLATSLAGAQSSANQKGYCEFLGYWDDVSGAEENWGNRVAQLHKKEKAQSSNSTFKQGFRSHLKWCKIPKSELFLSCRNKKQVS